MKLLRCSDLSHSSNWCWKKSNCLIVKTILLNKAAFQKTVSVLWCYLSEHVLVILLVMMIKNIVFHLVRHKCLYLVDLNNECWCDQFIKWTLFLFLSLSECTCVSGKAALWKWFNPDITSFNRWIIWSIKHQNNSQKNDFLRANIIVLWWLWYVSLRLTRFVKQDIFVPWLYYKISPRGQ